MIPKAVILDFDGTLVESVGIKDRAFESLFGAYPEWESEIEPYHRSHNATIRFEKFHHIVTEMLHEEYTESRGDELAQAFAEQVYQGLTECPWVDGALEALDRLGEVAPLYLVSVSPSEELDRVLAARGISDRFTRVYAHPWTKVDAFADILVAEGISAAEAVFVGDTREDREAAETVGIAFVGRDSGREIEGGVPVFGDMSGVAAHILGLDDPVAAVAATDVPETCPACGAGLDDAGTSIDYPGAADHDLAPSRIVTCGSCGSGVAVPPLTDAQLDELYFGGGYWDPKDVIDVKPGMFPGHYGLALARWNFVEPHLASRPSDEPLRILDIGAGHGFVGYAAALSSKVPLGLYWAAEPDQSMLRSLEASWPKYGRGAELGVSAASRDATGTFDLIVLSNVLEHLTESDDLLRFVGSRLAPGGLVFVDVPHRDDRFKADVFPHLVFFTQPGLERLLVRSGFEVTECAVFGKEPRTSPLGVEGRTFLDSLIDRAYALRRILPASLTSTFYASYFGAERRGADGTWLRAVARFTGDGHGGTK